MGACPGTALKPGSSGLLRLALGNQSTPIGGPSRRLIVREPRHTRAVCDPYMLVLTFL
jgi:hypothetical protein